MSEDPLASLLSQIPAPAQAAAGAVVAPDKKAREEASRWKDEIRGTQHRVLTVALWTAFAIVGFVAFVRGLHLVLPEEPVYIAGHIWLGCWLSEKQLSTIDHLLVSGAFVAAVGAGRNMLMKASPYE